MALRVSIPGVGVVSVEGAAEESTLQQLVGLTQRSIQSRTRLDGEVANLMKRQSSSAAEAAGSMSQLATDTRRASSASANYYSQLNEYVSSTSASFDGLGSKVASFAEQMATAPLTILGSWTKNFSGAGFGDPIVEAASTLSGGINLASSAISTFSSALGSIVKSIGLEKIGGLTEKLGDKAADLVGTVATGVNNRMAAELTSSVKNLATFNSMGASFSKGVKELRDMAAVSGMTTDQFTRSVKASREDIKGMGMNVRDGAMALATYSDYMSKATTDGTKDGRSYRNEMRMLGYSTEEQTELTAQYLAQLRQSMSAEQFRSITFRQVADGTKKYAEDLKVLGDITGKNAKAAMEEANRKSMEADIMAQLKPEEAEKFKKTYAAMPDYAKKGFLEYISSGGTAIVDAATNIAMSQNKEVENLIKEGYNGIKNQNKTASQVQDETLKRAAAAGEAQRKINREQGNAITMANRFTGQLGDAARIQNEITASAPYDAEAVEKSRKAAEDQAKVGDELSKGIVRATESAQDFANFNQQLASKYLPKYSSLIGDTSATVAEYSAAMLSAITGVEAGKKELERLLRRDVTKGAEAVGLPQSTYDTIITTLGEVSTVMKDTMKAVKELIQMITPRALGAMVKSPELSLLGEKGPEAVIPLQSGKIPVELGNLKGQVQNQADVGKGTELSQLSNSLNSNITDMMVTQKTSLKDSVSGWFDQFKSTFSSLQDISKATQQQNITEISKQLDTGFGTIKKTVGRPDLTELSKQLQTDFSSLQTSFKDADLSNLSNQMITGLSDVSSQIKDTDFTKDIKVNFDSTFANKNDPDRENFSALSQQMKTSISEAMANLNKNTSDTDLKPLKDSMTELPLSITEAITTAFNGQGGLVNLLTSVKDQMASDNSMTQTIFQQQIEKLDTLISTMQDNVRASENIANQLG